jgi:acyl-CoA oxidase
LVPIRDMETHRPLPGVEVGDIGPKFGFGAKDNGYCLFTNVRIPRTYMMMRYVSVDREGNISL